MAASVATLIITSPLHPQIFVLILFIAVQVGMETDETPVCSGRSSPLTADGVT